ncbi:MAG: NADAR family protein, partial [Pseudomonadota bacterium]
SDTPNHAKRLGREVQNFDTTVWEAHRFEIVVDANMAKFSQHPAMKAFLLNTGNKIIVEASPEDRIWGIGLAENAPEALDPSQWNGLNLLGFALMEVRDRLAQ